LTKYGNPAVAVLANSRVVYPIGVITGELNYPAEGEIKDLLKKVSAKHWLIDATTEAVRLGNSLLSNIIMIGALAASQLLPFDRKAFEKEISKSMTADKGRINLAAFDAGMKMMETSRH
jgi:indolepyruvate ferredoxin oxidoreductase, beta subunit